MNLFVSFTIYILIKLRYDSEKIKKVSNFPLRWQYLMWKYKKKLREWFKTSNFLSPKMPDFAATCATTAATSKILSATRAIIALTWFCHLSMYLWSLWGGAWWAPRGNPSYTWKKLQCLKMIFKPFGAKKNKKLGPPQPPPQYGIFHKYFFFLGKG